MWKRTELSGFARDGYVAAVGVVAPGFSDRASARIDELLTARPVPARDAGHHVFFESSADEPELTALLTETGAFSLARALTAPRTIPVPPQVHVALTYPLHPYRPGRGHLDGFSVTEPDDRPGTFTQLAGVVLSDQTRPGMGNLVVWPGSHRACAALLRDHGPDALLANGGYPDVPHDNLPPVCAAPGVVVLSSYLLSHLIGPRTADIAQDGLLPAQGRRR